MKLQGKRALVTGGAVRLGKAFSEALAASGCHIALHYGRSEESVRELVTALEKLNVEVSAHRADLNHPEEVEQLLGEVNREAGPVDILINNAAVFPDESFLTLSVPDWDRIFAVNLRAPFQLSRAFAAQAGALEHGVIINILDARIGRTGTDHFAYRLSKTALAEMTRMLALELAPTIRVNAVAPGAILPPPNTGEDYLESLARTRIPLRRQGSAGGLTAHVLHLLKSDFLTGVILPVDGGEYLG